METRTKEWGRLSLDEARARFNAQWAADRDGKPRVVLRNASTHWFATEDDWAQILLENGEVAKNNMVVGAPVYPWSERAS